MGAASGKSSTVPSMQASRGSCTATVPSRPEPPPKRAPRPDLPTPRQTMSSREVELSRSAVPYVAAEPPCKPRPSS